MHKNNWTPLETAHPWKVDEFAAGVGGSYLHYNNKFNEGWDSGLHY